MHIIRFEYHKITSHHEMTMESPFMFETEILDIEPLAFTNEKMINWKHPNIDKSKIRIYFIQMVRSMSLVCAKRSFCIFRIAHIYLCINICIYTHIQDFSCHAT